MNIGERVKFLNDVGGGIITKFIDKETAMILGDDGFEMPVSLKELLTIPDEKKQKPTTIPVTEKPSNLPQVEEEEEECFLHRQFRCINLFGFGSKKQ